MKKSFYLLSFLCLFGIISSVSGQSNTLFPNITANFNNESFKSILLKLESATNLQFFFKEEDLPTQKFSFSFQETPLDKALSDILAATTLDFIYYNNQAIILLPSNIARETFTIEYYKAREAALETADDRKEIVVGSINQLATSGLSKITGKVTDVQNNDEVIGASVFFKDLNLGTTTDVDGNFELMVPAGIHYLSVSYVGYEEFNGVVRVLSDGKLNVKLEKGAINLEEVTVSARKADDKVESVQIGVAEISVESIKKTPTFLGEADVIKSLLLNAGVSSIGEGATGFNVRGGDVDQNLILQDEGILLNSSHALGFFSSFNADLLENVELYKANMPAQFGGRLSSVMDVKMRDGNFEAFKIKGGIGPVTSRLSFEGPIVKEKVSFIGGFRASYSDWILDLVKIKEIQNSSVFFYDANFRITSRLSKNNTLILSGYASNDEFIYNNDFGFDYSTYLGQLIFKSILSEKLFSNFSISNTRYESTRLDLIGIDGSKLENNVNILKIKEQLSFSPTTLFKIDAGVTALLYDVEPGTIAPFGDESTISPVKVSKEKGLESAAFVNSEISISESLQLSAGLRVSFFQFLGPKTINEYQDPEHPQTSEITGTKTFGSGESIASYFNIEPRASLRYRINSQSSLKAGYSRTIQYLSQIFNSDAPTPVSQWQLANSFILPISSHNLSIGYFQNLKENNWETSAEIYTRFLDQLFDYKDFAQLVANESLETELLEGKGRSYGLELSIKKKEGVLNGSISYTLSRSERQIDGINRNNWYPSNFDKPHDLSVVFNFQPNRRNTLSINFIYGSGRPSTPPIGNFLSEYGLVVPIYSNRNQLRIPDYHRLDLAYTLGKGYKRDQKFQTSWTFSLYNVYGRKNAFSVFFTNAAFRGAQANKLAILGNVFPSITFNFEAL